MSRGNVLITGMGQFSGLGAGVPNFWSALVAGQRGIGPLNVAKPVGRGLGAVFPGLQNFAPQKRLDVALRYAIDEALADAQISKDPTDRKCIAVVGGSNFSDSQGWPAHGDFFKPLRDIAVDFRFGGEFWGLSTACASGVGILGLGYDLIRYEGIDTVLVCGYDIIDCYNYEGLASLRALSADDIRPFDRRRSGTVLGEGVGVLLLESTDSATERGVKPYGQIAGYGVSNDGYHFTAPEPTGVGMRTAMTQAIKEAAIDVKDINHLNAHGTGTLHNDRIETSAIHAIFQSSADLLPITSIKAAIGHCMGASGILESMAAILGLRDEVIPPTLNSGVRDPECDLDYVFDTSRPAQLQTVMCNSYGLWGCNASIVIKRPEHDNMRAKA